MKKKILQNDNGITVCDSIVMSIRQKRANLRRVEAVAIAVIGYVSAIMAFVGMFDFKFNHRTFIFSAVLFSAIYILLSLAGKKAMWIVGATVIAGGVISYRLIDTLILGCKYTYNVIYRTAMYKDIDYYKFLRPENEESSVTALFILGAWILAMVIYIFTVYHPNSLPPLLVTFPLIESGLYNGIEISVFWGMLLVAYWLAVFAMTAIDMGEYSGGNSGFVRKENIFFPKRQMKLKVTEKCGMYIIATVIAITAISSFVLDMIVYERSDEINQKRVEIRDAVNSFSVDDFAESISELTSAFGFTFKVQSHKLGNVDRLKYKESTDLIVTLDNKYNGAIYLKEYTGSVYNNNEWQILPDSAYRNYIFDDFKNYNTYPQDFPYRFSSTVNSFDSNLNEYTIDIDSKLRKNRSFAPYGIDNIGILEYDYDANVTSKSGNEYSYKFTKVDAEDIARKLDFLTRNTSTHNIGNYSGQAWESQLADYVSDNNLADDNGNFEAEDEIYFGYDAGIVLAELLENDYRDFVYENYLQIPDTDDINEVRREFADILNSAHGSDNQSQIALLTAIRDKISSMTEYSLNPGRTPATRDFVNYFLFENQKGYCTHYATSGVILARMAGIPARYATGYVIVGDDFNESSQNPDGSYTITLKDSRSHAWIEVYMDGYGWIPFEFTAGYSNQAIDTTPTTTTATESTETTTVESTEENGTTTRRNHRTTQDNRTNHTTYKTTVVTVTTVVEVTEITNESTPKAVKYIIYTVIAVIMTTLLIYLRRVLILYNRKKHFSNGSRRSRIAYMYSYTEKLLKYLKIKQEDMQYAEFALHVEEELSKIYFRPNEFKEFMDTALKSTFSEYPPENEELKNCLDFTSEFASEIYIRSGTLKKIYLKIILVLI